MASVNADAQRMSRRVRLPLPGSGVGTVVTLTATITEENELLETCPAVPPMTPELVPPGVSPWQCALLCMRFGPAGGTSPAGSEATTFPGCHPGPPL